MLRAALSCVALLFAAGATQGASRDVLVGAATSLTLVLREAADAHQHSTGQRVVLSLGPSNALARQIVAGAPVDLFISADEAQMDVAERAGRLVPGTRAALLTNQLAIVATRAASAFVRSPHDLTRPEVRRIAIGQPDAVPVGVYARSYLERLRLWRALAPKVVPVASARSALAAVEAGNADAAVVFRTDAPPAVASGPGPAKAGPHNSAPSADRGPAKAGPYNSAVASGFSRTNIVTTFIVPAADGPRIVYPAAIVKNGRNIAGAEEFLRFLRGPEGARIFERFGFGVAAAGSKAAQVTR